MDLLPETKRYSLRRSVAAARRAAAAVGACALAALLLGGCGQKGPLIKPAAAASAASAPVGR